MFENNIYKKIYKKIKEYNKIVIARHVGADPDALASTLALKEIILNSFPSKEIYVVGLSASKFKYLGNMDKLPEDTSDALLIITDTPDKKRIDGAKLDNFKYSIKIDHHPLVDEMCDIELIDETSSSACQLILELVYHTKFKLTTSSATKLFAGIVADTNRFLYYYSSPRTFELVSKLLKDKNIDITKIYEMMYLKPLNDKQFEGYILNNFNVTEDGLAYLVVNDDVLEKYKVDATTARNTVNEFNYINEILVWVIFTTDKQTGDLKGSIRSRGPIINTVASNFKGGGHIYASGVKINNDDELNNLIKELNLVCKNYKKQP